MAESWWVRWRRVIDARTFLLGLSAASATTFVVVFYVQSRDLTDPFQLAAAVYAVVTVILVVASLRRSRPRPPSTAAEFFHRLNRVVRERVFEPATWVGVASPIPRRRTVWLVGGVAGTGSGLSVAAAWVFSLHSYPPGERDLYLGATLLAGLLSVISGVALVVAARHRREGLQAALLLEFRLRDVAAGNAILVTSDVAEALARRDLLLVAGEFEAARRLHDTIPDGPR
ncbi:hypothetical protein [Actinoplanes sp. NBRC 101535]|uniref:hypothetical protein n=1 Tax=Actinoplanes sp. NBRC 101535 TaxID=3032196 RepID=UPI00255733FE|nr:hypothetical protein [Actinoplanes sp. NBRC 101535]